MSVQISNAGFLYSPFVLDNYEPAKPGAISRYYIKIKANPRTETESIRIGGAGGLQESKHIS